MVRLRRHRRGGFSLIEVMVAIAIFALLAMMAIPSAADWIRNTRLRSTAESLRSGLQLARGEAIRLNAGTRLQLVTTLGNDCALSTTGAFWVSNIGLAQTPASACNSTIGASSAPNLIGASPVNTNSDVAILSNSPVIGFDSLGRQAPTTNPTSSIAKVTINLTSTGGTCVAAGGNVRCLNVVVYATGDSKICDPTRTSNTDPLSC